MDKDEGTIGALGRRLSLVEPCLGLAAAPVQKNQLKKLCILLLHIEGMFNHENMHKIGYMEGGSKVVFKMCKTTEMVYRLYITSSVSITLQLSV